MQSPLRQYRHIYKYTQEDLAKLAKVSRYQVSRLENGTMIELKALVKISNVFGLEPKEMLYKRIKTSKEPNLGCFFALAALLIYLIIINT